MATKIDRSKLDRRFVAKELLADRGDMLVIAGLGAAAWDVTAVGDSPLNFPLWGAMGGALAMGLGLALAQPKRRVLALTGDGEILMGLGSLATIGVQQPKNLAVVVLDNEHYGETGMQRTHTSWGVDIAKAALACGFADASIVSTKAEIAKMCAAVRKGVGPMLFQVKVVDVKSEFVLPPRDGAHLKHRFREALLGAREAHR
jgi:thiamine pyrophosphate-dependent acetolactate synthase large subunit-like protein